MEQSAGNDTGLGSGPRHHGILGCYSPSSDPDLAAQRIGPMREALDTQIPTFAESAPGVAVVATGSLHTLPGGGYVTVSGAPYFRDSALSQSAQTAGVAAVILSLIHI